MSRVRRGEDLYLRDFKPEYISANWTVEMKMNAMKISCPYNFQKVYLDSKIFNQQDNEIKIGYININSLLTGQSCTFLNHDENLLNLDVLVVSDTRLQQDTTDDHLGEELSNWNILKRFDAYDDMKHMGLLLLSSKKSQQSHVISGVWKKYWKKMKGDKNLVFAQLLVVQLSDKKEFGFMYIRETPSLKEVEGFVKDIKDLDILAGDLNLDPEREDDMRKLTVLLANNKTLALKEVTTSRNNQLDHILVNKKMFKDYFCTSFLNFTSDHKVITMRMPIEENSFSEKFREDLCFERDCWTRKKTRQSKPFEQTLKNTCNIEDLEENIDKYFGLLNQHSSKKIVLQMASIDQQNSSDYFKALPSNLKDIQIMKTPDVYLLVKCMDIPYILHWTSENLTLYSLGSKEEKPGQVVLEFVKCEYIDQLYNSFSAPCPKLRSKVKTITAGEENMLHVLTLLKHEIFGVSFDFGNLNSEKLLRDIYCELRSHKLFPLSKKRKQPPVKSSTPQNSKKARKDFRTFSNPDNETCWLNSCLQLMLALLDHSAQTFQAEKSELLRFMISLKNSGGTTLNPLPIRDLVMKVERNRIISEKVVPDNRLFHYYGTSTKDIKKLEKISEDSTYGQQDCKDFFICLNENKKQWQDVVNLFEISTFQKTVCQSCGGTQSDDHSEQHSYLSLDCPNQDMSLKHLINIRINEAEDVEGWRHEDGCRVRTTGKHFKVIQNIEKVKFLLFVVPRLYHTATMAMEINKTKIEVNSEVEVRAY